MPKLTLTKRYIVHYAVNNPEVYRVLKEIAKLLFHCSTNSSSRHVISGSLTRAVRKHASTYMPETQHRRAQTRNFTKQRDCC